MAKIPETVRKHGKEEQEETKRAREVVGEGRGCGIRDEGRTRCWLLRKSADPSC